MQTQALSIGTRLNDRWSTFYVYKYNDLRYACACEIIHDVCMNDEEKLADFKTRKDRYAFDNAKLVSLIERARKSNKRMQELIRLSNVYMHEAEEGIMFCIDAKIVDVQGTSVQMFLTAVSAHGVDCTQWFSEDEFGKRFLAK
jgi:hypothetical protein